MENLINSIDNQCCVCLNIIDENDKCFLKCSHFLCNSCIDSWFDQNKTTCHVLWITSQCITLISKICPSGFTNFYGISSENIWK